MLLKDLKHIDYSFVNGCFYKEFTHEGVLYKAELQPYPVKGSQCIIRRIDNKEDIKNVTASEDSQLVFRKGALAFNEDSLREAIKEFCKR